MSSTAAARTVGRASYAAKGGLDAVVIGAGPAGLGAAQSLMDGGAHVTLLEADRSVGGMARSHRVGGHMCDVGPHRLHAEASSAVRTLLGGSSGLRTRKRAGRLHLGARQVDYPLSLLATLRSLGLTEAARLFWGALGARFQTADGSYSGEARRRVGKPIYEMLYAPAAEKIWGRAPEQLDAEQARARISAAGVCALLNRVLGRGEPGHYLYPRAGANGLAYDAWAQRLVERGMSLVCGARAERILHRDGRTVGVVAAVDGQSRRFNADRVISTLPLPLLLQMIDPALAAEHRPALAFRTVVILQIVLRTPRLSDKDVHYFPQREVPFARLCEQSAFGRIATAPKNETVVSLDFYDERNGPIARASAEELLEQALPHLAVFGVTREQVVTVARVVRDNAYPILTRDYEFARSRCLDAAASIEGVLSTGRAGLFLHVNQHHAIEMGLSAGRCAVGKEAVSQRWRAQATEFDGLRIVD